MKLISFLQVTISLMTGGCLMCAFQAASKPSGENFAHFVTLAVLLIIIIIVLTIIFLMLIKKGHPQIEQKRQGAQDK